MMPQEVVNSDVVYFKFLGVTCNERGNIRAFEGVEDRGRLRLDSQDLEKQIFTPAYSRSARSSEQCFDRFLYEELLLCTEAVVDV